MVFSGLADNGLSGCRWVVGGTRENVLCQISTTLGSLPLFYEFLVKFEEQKTEAHPCLLSTVQMIIGQHALLIIGVEVLQIDLILVTRLFARHTIYFNSYDCRVLNGL